MAPVRVRAGAHSDRGGQALGFKAVSRSVLQAMR